MEPQNTFQQFIMFLGPYKWPLFLLTLVILVIFAVKIFHLFILKKPETKWMNALLFWGIVTTALGLLGQVNGIWIALNSIISAPDISPPMVMIGFLSTFSTTLYGLVVGLFAALAWWGMRFRLSRLQKTAKNP